MSKSIRRFLSFLLVLQLIMPYSSFAAAVGEFSSVVGKVTQTRAKEVVTPVVKSPIQLKDLIVTARSASATMLFSDDSTIRLSENSKLEIKEFLFKEKSRTGVFSLAVGKVSANVKKYIGGENVFEVRSPTAVAGVRGTGFEFVEAVNVENKKMATVSCTEGSLNLSALSPTGQVTSTAVLEAGQMAVVIGGIITISKIAAATAASAASSSKTGTAGAAGGTGTGTGAGAAGGAAAATGLSTAAIAGIAVGGTAAVVAAAAAISSSRSSSSSSSSSSTPTTPTTPGGTAESATLSFRLYEPSSDDFDMIITKPNGAEVRFYTTSEYSQDSVGGSGPDIAFWQSPLNGTYTIQIQCYSNNNVGVSKNVSLEVWKNGARSSTLTSITVPGTVSNGAIVGSATYTY